ncbi:sigma-54-dependent transcriptional regulator [Companilactobacillus halodurans]|uniref:DNA translocase FtsK n=1 Tax=Companilactobacillus halodurans TaxID=2584183 RepID=A0A5P0ZZ67_9LACO|nr:sigma-54-dependent transcriptional regulator [Companilactobacillus halodurans]MQS76915.1 PRD domain-containing protein [Companilactobacillus halodurans]MQS98376.1 PRD domain-containing protein [Companilactobacillus halodurans]
MRRIETIASEISNLFNNLTKETLIENGGISASTLADKLGLSRSNVSADLNKLFRQGELVKVKSYPVCYIPVDSIKKLFNVSQLPTQEFSNIEELKDLSENKPQEKIKETHDPFEEIIGYDGSLKKPISQAKAAVFYPPHGLHMLLLGPTGSGKTYFANKIYQYAVYEHLLSADAPFKSFNCADYYQNPQLLLSQLFGYCKGVFTGADEDHKGLVEEADGGILLLDEVHRLTPEGQEMLFYLIDNGMFSRLGDNGTKRKANVLIICATTENPSSTMLDTFLRRIPMTIQIPSLKDRGMKEKVELIKYLMLQESKRVKKSFRVDMDVINALIHSVNYGNVGQLKSQIQLTCAQAFLNNLYNKTEIRIAIKDLPEEIRDDWLSSSQNIQRSKEISKYVDIVTVISPGVSQSDELDEYDDSNIYNLIEEKYNYLKKKGMKSDQIYKYVLNDLHLHVNKFISKNSVNYHLLKFIDPKVYDLTVQLKKIGEKELKVKFDRRFLYYVGMHIDSYYKRDKQESNVENINIEDVKNNFSSEYHVAQIFAEQINKKLNIDLPEMEIIYLTMLINSIEKFDDKKTVSVLVAAHGNSTATSMVAVSKELLGTAPIYSLDMPLNISPEELFDSLVEKIKTIDNGKGVLMLVDMGSLNMMENKLMKKTGIKLKTIPNVTTSIVLDTVRKINYMNLDLNGIYESVSKDFSDSYKLATSGKTKVILSICTTGEGTAKKIEQFLNDIIIHYSDDNVKVIRASALHLKDSVAKVDKNYQIIASVGTKDPKLNVPFVSLEELVSGHGEDELKRVLGVKVNSKRTNSNKMVISDICLDTLNKYLLYLNPTRIIKMLMDWIKELQIQMGKNFNNSTIVKLVVHTAFSFERCVSKNPIHYDDEVSKEVASFLPLLNQTINPMENKLDLHLDKDEKLFICEILNSV